MTMLRRRIGGSQAVVARDVEHLADDLAGGQVALQAHQRRQAELAVTGQPTWVEMQMVSRSRPPASTRSRPSGPSFKRRAGSGGCRRSTRSARSSVRQAQRQRRRPGRPRSRLREVSKSALRSANPLAIDGIVDLLGAEGGRWTVPESFPNIGKFHAYNGLAPYLQSSIRAFGGSRTHDRPGYNRSRTIE